MPAEIVFSGGQKVEVRQDTKVLMRQVTALPEAPRTGDVPRGWLEVETKEGHIYVNTTQIAYVRDTRERSREPRFT